MEVTESTKSSVMAPSTAAPSVIVALHSLVILNISEHWTRVRAQLGKPIKGSIQKFKSGFMIFKIHNYFV